MPATTNVYRAKLFRLGGPGSGNFGHAGRPGEIGGSSPDDGSAAPPTSGVVHHDTKPSIKGKNIASVDDQANPNVVQDVLGMSEPQVQDLAASMVQYVDNEQFEVKILTEGGGPSEDELQEGYDEYVNNARAEVQGDWAGTRWSRQEEIKRLWEQVQAEENFPDTADAPKLSFEELTKDVDITGPLTTGEGDTVKALLRQSGGPELLSLNEWRDRWNNEEGDSYEPDMSFREWTRNEGHSEVGGRSSDLYNDPVVRMSFRGSNGTTITREFKHDENGNLIVDHAWFKTYKTGGGMAKDVMRASFDEYARLGVSKVLVHANVDVGGYAWAKFGFRVTDPPDVDDLFRQAERKGKITHEERVMLEDVATEHEGEDTQLWHIADAKNGDKKIGAAVLLNSDWSGELRMDDPVAMGRLRKYIAEVKPPSESAPPVTLPQKSEGKKARMGSGTVTEHVLAADPPLPPPGDGSREMFYEEKGRRQDRELWRELLGEDFPDEESLQPSLVNLAADVHAGVNGPGGVGAAFTTVPKTARARARWIRRNQSRYDTDPEFKTVADAVTLLTQGASAPLHLASWADGHDPADLLREQGTPGKEMGQTLTQAVQSLGQPLSSVAHPMGAYTNAFAGQDVAQADEATVGQAGQALNRAIATAPLLTQPVYRGQRLTLPHPAWQAITTLGPGDPFPMHGATAMTTDAALAEAFARGTATGQPGAAQAKAGLASDQRPVVLMLEPGARGLPVGVLSSWRNAQEVITRGDFTVVRVDGANGLTRIVLRPSPPMPTSLRYRAKVAMLLGDVEGHPFRGNQYTAVAGEGGGKAAPSGVQASMDRLTAAHPDVAQHYAEDSGTEMGSIRSHTSDVGALWPTQMPPAELAPISDRWGHDLAPVLHDALALHDIGKGQAIANGDKDRQHEYTIPILQRVLRAEGHPPMDVALVSALLDHDVIGRLAQRGGSPASAAERLRKKAESVGMPVPDFARLQLAIFHADAGSYPYVRQFLDEGPDGKLSHPEARRIERAMLDTGARDLGYRTKVAFLLGDEPGHPFRGNQYTDVAGGGSPGASPLSAKEREKQDQDNDLAAANLKKIVTGEVFLGGVNESGRQVTARVANRVREVLTEFRDRGYALPEDVAVYSTYDRTPSGHTVEYKATKDVAGHPQGTSWRALSVDMPAELPGDADLDKAVRLAFANESGAYSVQSLRDIIIHEMGHVQAKRLPSLDAFLTEELKKPDSASKWTLARTKNAMERVSRYAMTNPDEFIAETFTRLYRGDKLHPESMKLYKLWGGPEIRS